jgi:CheY-like chemotaxis protein
VSTKAAGAPRAKRALLVDDSAAARQELARLLEPLGLEVAEADGGAAALRILVARRFDVVFLDLEMPALDGASLFRLIRARGDRVPVVLTTATRDMRALSAAVKLGAAGYLPKPYDGGALRVLLEPVLGEPGGAAPGGAT